MAIKPKFSKYLVNQSRSERVDYFKKSWAAHRTITQAATRILSIIREPANVGMIYLVGPTGVGKSTLLRHVVNKVYEDALPELEKRRGWIPAAYMLASNPENGVYDWTGHFIKTMEAIQEVLIERKVYIPDLDEPQSKSELINRSRPTSTIMRRAAERALKNRGCGVFIVDDAHYIGKRRSGEQLINQTDTIKSIADQSETLHLLAGTYDLLPLRNLNGQLGRKSITIHFSNYKYQDDDDIKSFVGAMKHFLGNLPLEEVPDFTEDWEYCYAMSAGCIGVLKDWFVRTLDAAITDNQGRMTFDLFKDCKPPTAVISRIAEEISNGELLLKEEDDEKTYSQLLGNLNMNASSLMADISNLLTPPQGKKLESEVSKKAEKKGAKRIETKPHRYPIGLDKSS